MNATARARRDEQVARSYDGSLRSTAKLFGLSHEGVRKILKAQGVEIAPACTWNSSGSPEYNSGAGNQSVNKGAALQRLVGTSRGSNSNGRSPHGLVPGGHLSGSPSLATAGATNSEPRRLRVKNSTGPAATSPGLAPAFYSVR